MQAGIKMAQVFRKRTGGLKVQQPNSCTACCTSCSPETGETKPKEAKGRLFAVIVASILLAAGILFRDVLHSTPYAWGEYLTLLTAYLLVGGRIVQTALSNLLRGNIFDEHFLMSVATIGAIIIGQFSEAVAVMLFYTIGEYLQDLAVDRSRRSITALLEIRPDYANLKVNGDIRKVKPEVVEVGQVIVVRPGERVPLDGEVTQGTSFVDTSALTGESVPRRVEVGENVLAGSVNGQGLLEVKVTKPLSESSISKILDLIRNAASRKAPTEQFITTFARYYTPVAVFGALAVAVIPPLLLPGATFTQWVYRALVLLVISCPCALMVSIPLSYFGGLGGASRNGILVKGANFLEGLTRLHTVVFDKTGTLTRGVFKVTSVVSKNGYSRDDVLKLAAAAESNSNHPIARSILDAYEREVTPNTVGDFQEISGYGVKARVDGRLILAGNDSLLHRENVPHDICNVGGTVVYIGVDGLLAGYIIISDEVKDDAAEAIAGLKHLGVKKTVMLTGDDETTARQVSAALNIDTYIAQLLPEDKLARIEALQASLPNPRKNKLMFVGDGINDAPGITRADIGVAMGALCSDAAIEAADVVIMDDRPSKLVTAVKLARRTQTITIQNIALALGVKGFFAVLGTLGVATVWEAVFADVGIALLAVLNATRTLNA